MLSLQILWSGKVYPKIKSRIQEEVAGAVTTIQHH